MRSTETGLKLSSPDCVARIVTGLMSLSVSVDPERVALPLTIAKETGSDELALAFSVIVMLTGADAG